MKYRYQCFWLISTLSYIANNEILSAVLFVSILVLMLRNLWNETFFIENLPYAIVLSPALFVIKISSYNLLFSDLLIFFGGFFLILVNTSYKKAFKCYYKSSLLVKLFLAIFVFNFFQMIIYSLIGEYTNYKFLLYMLFHMILFFALLGIDMGSRYHKLLLKSFLMSVFLAVVMVLYYYIQGESMLAWSGGDFASASDLPEHLFFRATYFYSGFFFYLGSSIGVLVYLSLNNSFSYSKRLLIIVALLFEIVAAIAFINKTLFVSLICSLVIIQFYRLGNTYKKDLHSKIIKSLLGLGVILSLIAFADFSKFSDFIGFATQTESLSIRYYIYGNSLKLLFADPFHLLFGEGLGFLSSNEPKSLLYKTNEYGQIEGTIDSQLMNILIETGIVGFLVVICFGIAVVYRLYKLKRDDEQFAVPVFSIVIFIAICFITQRIGMAKLSLMLPVLTVLVAKYRPRTI